MLVDSCQGTSSNAEAGNERKHNYKGPIEVNPKMLKEKDKHVNL